MAIVNTSYPSPHLLCSTDVPDNLFGCFTLDSESSMLTIVI